MSTVSKVLYKPVSLAASAAGGAAAGVVFRRVWHQFSAEPAPTPTDLHRPTTEVVAAAAVQGVVFGVIRALLDRAAARAYLEVTHTPPT